MFNIYQSGGQGLKKPHCGQLFSSIFDHSRKNNGQALLWLLLWGSTIAITTPMRQASTSDRVRAVRLLLMTVGLSAYSSCQAASACLGTCAPAPTRASCAPLARSASAGRCRPAQPTPTRSRAPAAPFTNNTCFHHKTSMSCSSTRQASKKTN